jgi:hypothetical protein
MARLAPALGPAELAARLGALGVRVEAAEVCVERVSLADYPGGRPSSVVRLSGAGCTGKGENVAFEPGEHERFVATVNAWFHEHGSARLLEVGSALPGFPSSYERAALEAALVDLALRQANLTLADLTGIERGSLRFVASLAATDEPLAAIGALRAAGFRGELKLDVTPSWSREVRSSLRGVSGVSIADFKRRGDAEFGETIAALFPDALLEDPPDAFTPNVTSRARIVRDATLLDESAVAAALARDESVNLKAPRMGGPLAVLRSLELALRHERTPKATAIPVSSGSNAYLGGMFEVGIGRVQARLLAALYCPAAPNDLALNPRAAPGAPRSIDESPAPMHFDAPGFGTEL